MQLEPKANVVEMRGSLIPSPTQPSMDPEETTRWEQLAPRRIEAADLWRFEGYMGEIFAAFGVELRIPSTERSPERFLKALYDATAGYEGDPKLLTAFPTECRCDADCLVSQVIEGPISFYSLCGRVDGARELIRVGEPVAPGALGERVR